MLREASYLTVPSRYDRTTSRSTSPLRHHFGSLLPCVSTPNWKPYRKIDYSLVMPLLMLLAVVLASSAFGLAILHPITSAPKKHSPRTFQVSDLLSLSVILTIPFAFYSTVRRTYGSDAYIGDLLALILVSTFLYIWWRGTSTLTRIGVSDGIRRFIYLSIVLPIAVLGAAFAAPSVVMLAVVTPRMNPNQRSLWFMGLIATVLVAYICRITNHWIISETNEAKHSHPLEENAR